jgi:hypothetical protein
MSMIGKTLAHYEITSQLGKGGMGEVFRATSAMKGKEAKGQNSPLIWFAARSRSYCPTSLVGSG